MCKPRLAYYVCYNVWKVFHPDTLGKLNNLTFVRLKLCIFLHNVQLIWNARSVQLRVSPGGPRVAVQYSRWRLDMPGYMFAAPGSGSRQSDYVACMSWDFPGDDRRQTQLARERNGDAIVQRTVAVYLA